jgi:uncharacterized protein (DUF433 family)
MLVNTTINFPTNIGSYTVMDAARLLKMKPAKIKRWVKGYRDYPPLWAATYPMDSKDIELSFKDLIELKFLNAFEKTGLTAKTIRSYYKAAQRFTKDERPFSTRLLKTDSSKIYFDDGKETIELKSQQHNFTTIIEQSFKDLILENNTVSAWHPLPDSNVILIDPRRSFGRPILEASGVPTVVLFDCYKAEKNSLSKTAYFFDVSEEEVKKAIEFETFLAAA